MEMFEDTPQSTTRAQKPKQKGPDSLSPGDEADCDDHKGNSEKETARLQR